MMSKVVRGVKLTLMLLAAVFVTLLGVRAWDSQPRAPPSLGALAGECWNFAEREHFGLRPHRAEISLPKWRLTVGSRV